MEIAIDFDGTVVEHKYPEIGRDIGAIPVLKRLVEAGHKLILFTMRDGYALWEATNWFKQNGIDLYGVNLNPIQKSWTDSNKCFANLYIDDAALGIPLMESKDPGVKRPCVNWVEVEHLLVRKGVLEERPVDLASLELQPPTSDLVVTLIYQSADPRTYDAWLQAFKAYNKDNSKHQVGMRCRSCYGKVYQWWKTKTTQNGA